VRGGHAQCSHARHITAGRQKAKPSAKASTKSKP
jgi:hypothetical protein